MTLEYVGQPLVEVLADGEKIGELWHFEGEGWTQGGWTGSPDLASWLLSQGLERHDVANISAANTSLRTLRERVSAAVEAVAAARPSPAGRQAPARSDMARAGMGRGRG